MAVQKTQGIILRREEIRETSLILTIFTKDFGKLKLISKGVRNPDQRFIAAYELFSLNDIVFYEKKKRNVFLLSQCELVDFFPKIRRSLERLCYATYLIELSDAVTALGDKNPAFFELLVNALNFLSSEASPKRVARVFEIKLLSLLGLMPVMASCVNCGGKVENKKMRFSLALGGLLCERCFAKDTRSRNVSLGTANFISHVEHLSFNKVRQVKVSEKVGKELEGLLKSFINYHVDVRLRSREFIERVGL